MSNHKSPVFTIKCVGRVADELFSELFSELRDGIFEQSWKFLSMFLWHFFLF